MDDARDRLNGILRRLGPPIVAFSGGVDSTLLLRVAHELHGEGVLAVMAVSPSLATTEREEAGVLANLIGARLQFVETHELDDPGYVRNDGRRCYHCKRELFRVVQAIADRAHDRAIVYGAILDDLGEVRPGMQAASEAGVRAPLLEAGYTKAMVRDLSRRLGLPTWDKPAMACLASRIPVHTPVTAAALSQVDAAEAAVRGLGFRQVRVRHHGMGASVEVDRDELSRALEPAMSSRITQAVREAGFETVLIDPLGYRSGGRLPAGRHPDV